MTCINWPHRDGAAAQPLDRDGNVLANEKIVLSRLKKHFEELMNAENEKEKEGWRAVSSSERGVD